MLILNRIKALFHDYWFETLILFCCLIYFGYCTYNITMGIAPKTEPRETSFPWNTQILLDSGEPPHTAEIIKRSDIRYGKRVRKTCLQDDRVLFVFASEPDRRVQLLVFNVFGEYRYGYWVYMENHVQAALSPCYEGILLFDYKKRDGNRCPVSVYTPYGNHEKKLFAYTDDLGFTSEAYIDCSSDYEAIRESEKYVIRNRESLEKTAIFDFSQTTTN